MSYCNVLLNKRSHRVQKKRREKEMKEKRIEMLIIKIALQCFSFIIAGKEKLSLSHIIPATLFSPSSRYFRSS